MLPDETLTVLGPWLTATRRRRPYLTLAYALDGQDSYPADEQPIADLRGGADLVLSDGIPEEGMPGGHANAHFALGCWPVPSPTDAGRSWPASAGSSRSPAPTPGPTWPCCFAGAACGDTPQERELRPLDRAIPDAHRIAVNQIVHATAVTAATCPIPIVAYAGERDGVVTPGSARSVLPDVGVLPGDHFSIIKPDSHRHRSYVA
ncbi:hypothetical protein [Micromonospora sp. WMMD980]|uniref:hypothetical protein n=1 Tax=Micromonospora sp. WMMD980 TaxID=3016088 RepID=UPI0024168C12|nr:hypothetical protein [Micromonospora sp. WMMD980]MDG4799928.1 hypothetical protein [Micromonospora sp. WMMD980]